MKIKLYLLFIALTACFLPEKGFGGNGGYPKYPRIQTVDPVAIEVNQTLINLTFHGDFGVVTSAIQDADGVLLITEETNTTFRHSAEINCSRMPAGTYIVSVTTTDGTLLTKEAILLP